MGRKSKTIKCVEPAVRSELLDRQLSDLLGDFALPSEYADEMREMIARDEIVGKADLEGKISGLRSEITHLSEKLQRLLDGFLDGVLERDIYTAKKAEIMSQKKTLEEQMSDLALGNLEWVEPFKNWLNKAVSICKIAKSDDQNAKKPLLLEIFGLNLVLRGKNITAPREKNPISPFPNTAFASGEAEKSIWLAFRQAKINIALSGDKNAKNLFLEAPTGFEPVYAVLQTAT